MSAHPSIHTDIRMTTANIRSFFETAKLFGGKMQKKHLFAMFMDTKEDVLLS